ncbi:MAG: energy-coupling factor transporter ATPase [Clostridiales bacterium]|nr:energy-coupling factor transporter ATPase [Clostridiales bacterium]
MLIRLDHVTHTYQPGSPFQATAIRDVTLEIRPGEFLALIGHTGCGKSTLAQHINGLLKPTEGRVLLDGKDIHEKGFNRKDLRRAVGLVFQYPEHQLFEETVFKDVAFGPRNLGLSEDEIKERVEEALERVGLSDPGIAEKSPFELSGGQMRRAAMAGVLAMRPEVLVLDEPAAGLDPQSREDMLQLISHLHSQGTTVVMISHSMDDVARFADRAVVMEKGAIAMEGTPEEIFRHGERLESMGLDVPSVCRIGMLLRRKGVACPEEMFREDQAFDALLALWKGGKAHGVQ